MQTYSLLLLSRPLEAIAKSIKHTTAMSKILAKEMSQTRLDVVLATSKILLDSSNHELRNAPINSKTLFGNNIKEVAKGSFEAQQQRFLATSSVATFMQQQNLLWSLRDRNSRLNPLGLNKRSCIGVRVRHSHTHQVERKRSGNQKQFPSSKQASSSTFSQPMHTGMKDPLMVPKKSYCRQDSSYPRHLRISSNNSDSFCPEQDTPVSVQNSSYSPSLAATNVVLRGSTTTCLSSSWSSTLSKTINMSKRKVSTSEPPSSQLSRLGVIKQSVRDRKFSQNIADCVSKSRRTSTQKVHDAKWIVYTHWCHRRKVNPVSTSLTVIADFLIYLFSEKKYQISTIKGYKSVISNTLKFKTGNRIGSNPVLSELIRSFELQLPVQRSLMPKWDLSWDLVCLQKAPYEPLHKASKLHVTLKTAFLLALATAKRCSKIHALAMDSKHLRFNQSGTGQWVCTFRHRELVTRQLTLSPDTSHWSSNTYYWAPVTDHQFGTRHQLLGTRYQMVNYTQSLNLEQSATNEPPSSMDNQRLILPLEPDFNTMSDLSIVIEPSIITW